MEASLSPPLQRLHDLFRAVTHCNTITVPFNVQRPSPEAVSLGALFTEWGISHRTRSRHKFLGFVISTPLDGNDVRILGRAYRDSIVLRWKEDLFEISSMQVRYLAPEEAEASYPEYAGTHWGDKSYLVSADQI